MAKEDQEENRPQTTVRSLLERAEQNKASLEGHFAETGVRVRGFNDLLRHLDAAAEVAATEEPLRLLAFFVARARTNVQMAIAASYFGLLSVAADAMRDTMEIALLLREFSQDVASLERWFKLSERERQREFGPNRLRQLHANRIGMPVEDLPDSRDYRAHSMTLHVGPNRTVFRRGLVSSPDVLTETDVAFAEILGHARQVTVLSHELAQILHPGTAMPDPASATEFQRAADNAQEFTLPVLISMLEVIRDERRSRTEGDLGLGLPVPDESKRHTAIHEAGHAVVAAALKFLVEAVSLGSELGGAIQGRVVTNAAQYDLPTDRLEDAVVVALAGNLAEEMLLGKVERVPGIVAEREHDEQQLQWLFSVLCPWGSDEVRKRCDARARELIEGTREAITDLAERLMTGEVIKHYEILQEDPD